MKNIIVYGSTKEIAFKKLQDLLDYMPYKDVKEVKRNKDNFEVITNNDEIYKAAMANDYARGYRWHFAYVDYHITKENLKNIIYCSSLHSDINSVENNMAYYNITNEY